VPFKAKAACRHHIPKQRHRVTNWAEYDAALRANRSSCPEAVIAMGVDGGLLPSAGVRSLRMCRVAPCFDTVKLKTDRLRGYRPEQYPSATG
jgi:hypothetical protein